MNWLAALLLATGVGRHLGYYLVRDEWHAQVWNITAALIITGFLWSIAWRWKSTVLVAIWWTFEELQVVTCSVLWMWNPWVVKKGEDQCSAPYRLRPEFDWSALDWAGSVVDEYKEEKPIMTERRPATTIEQLDIHFGYMMAELKDMRERLDHTFTLLSSKQEEMGKSHASLINEVNELRARVESQAPRSIGRLITEIAIGITAVSGAFYVVVSIFRYLKL